MKYTTVDIIFNPNSTGPSSDNALRLKKELKKEYPKLTVNLRRTKYAGHATKISYKCARGSKTPLIISSSGDGGYNEVINGAMQAQAEGAAPVCAVLASGNANDHSRAVIERPLLNSIMSGKEMSIDLLKATFATNSSQQTHYAHSYIGLGLTPAVAIELNKTNLNALKEAWIVIKTFYKFRSFEIRVGKNVTKLDSIIFANIPQMAKFFTLVKKSKIDDGLFEVIKFRHSHKLALMRLLARASVSGLKDEKQSEHFSFVVLKKMAIQLDGEVYYIDKNSTVDITCEPNMLKTLV